jgi:hypothetical protein
VNPRDALDLALRREAFVSKAGFSEAAIAVRSIDPAPMPFMARHPLSSQIGC